MSPFDDEIEAEVQRVLNRGAESRRAEAVAQLGEAPPGAVVRRVATAALGIAAAVAVFYLLGAVLALDALVDVCRAIGLCS